MHTRETLRGEAQAHQRAHDDEEPQPCAASLDVLEHRQRDEREGFEEGDAGPEEEVGPESAAAVEGLRDFVVGEGEDGLFGGVVLEEGAGEEGECCGDGGEEQEGPWAEGVGGGGGGGGLCGVAEGICFRHGDGDGVGEVIVGWI